jgi:hypothetical protein
VVMVLLPSPLLALPARQEGHSLEADPMLLLPNHLLVNTLLHHPLLLPLQDTHLLQLLLHPRTPLPLAATPLHQLLLLVPFHLLPRRPVSRVDSVPLSPPMANSLPDTSFPADIKDLIYASAEFSHPSSAAHGSLSSVAQSSLSAAVLNKPSAAILRNLSAVVLSLPLLHIYAMLRQCCFEGAYQLYFTRIIFLMLPSR